MVAAGFEVNLEEEIAVRGGNEAVMEDGFLRPGAFVVEGEALVLVLVADKPVHHLVFVLRRAVFDDSPIGFLHLSVAEHRVQAGQRLAGLGKKDYAADRAIQAVGDTDEDIAGLGIFLFEPRLEHFREGLVAGLVALHDFAAGFVHRNEVIVFVDNFHERKSIDTKSCKPALRWARADLQREVLVLHIHTAIYLDNLAGNIGRKVGCEEEGDVRHVFRRTATAQRYLLAPFFADILGQSSRHVRDNESR